MHVQGTFEWVRGVGMVCLALIALVSASPALAEKGKLLERLTPAVMAAVYPGAERLGPEEGEPPAIPVFKGDKVVGYVFSTLDVIAAPGYSTTPFDVIAGIDTEGRITGAKVVFHQEPIIQHDLGLQSLLDELLASQAGRKLVGGMDKLPPDHVHGATISARAMRTAVLVTARLVLRPRLARPASVAQGPAPVDISGFITMSVDDLIANGAVAKRRVTSGEVAAALARAGAPGATLDWPLGPSDDLYIEFVTALVTPMEIGANLLGLVRADEYTSQLPPGAEAIYIASSGPYDFFGSKYFQASEGNLFDRVRLVQGGRTFTFHQRDYTYALPAGGQQLAALLALPPNSGFDPKRPWRLEVLVHGTGAKPVTIPLGLDYRLPDFIKNGGPPPIPPAPVAAAAQPAPVLAADALPELDLDEAPPVAAWVEAWSDARTDLIILAALLITLTLIFVFQDTLARHRLAHRVVRLGFLTVVLVWLGWTAGVQLSTVNVINYAMAPFSRFELGFYLAEPLMVIIAIYTLFSVILIGRGVFCGWLCPFGALQELLGEIAKALRIPQWSPSAALEQRLWWGKYIAAATVLILVLSQIDSAGATLEVEPFKTAITTKFTRAWPYVVYAGVLLAIGLFSERAYCRFLCPLGGILATLDRFHLLNRLKRRPECGSPCRLCERACPVRAIVPSGKIVTSECFQCLDCQVEYFDDKRCPPLVRAVKLRGDRPITVTVRHA
jgi:NosR/NirI family nitrous oxide reductase transcriptional regulator